jgi:hypothetical protein
MNEVQEDNPEMKGYDATDMRQHSRAVAAYVGQVCWL